MRKFITTMLIAAAAFTACVQNDDNIVVNTDNKITFTAQLNAPESRTVLVKEDNKFHAEWCVGDNLKVFEVTDVSFVNDKDQNQFYHAYEKQISVGGATVTEPVTLDVWEATKYTYVLVSPDASMNAAALYLAFTINGQQAPAAMNTFDGNSDIIVSKPIEMNAQPANETLTFVNTRLNAFAEIGIKVPTLDEGDAVKSVTFTCDRSIAGKITKFYLEDLETDPFKRSSNSAIVTSITVTLPESQKSDFTYYMSCWPVTIPENDKVTITLVTENDKKYVKETTIPEDLAFTSGDITAFTVNMKGIKENNPIVMPEYVEVAGIKWATGNLWYDKDGDTKTGFENGWSIAPTQDACIVNTTDGPTTRDVFNFGGITDPWSSNANSCANITEIPENGFSISGKLYTDQTCATVVTDFASATFGDIAYWASKGQYRMPTAEEFATLIANANSTLAKINNIHGVYFWNPTDGEERKVANGSTEVELTEDKLINGLFFPAIGRGYNVEDSWSVNAVGTTFMYRAGDVEIEANWGNNAAETCYGVVANLKLAGTTQTAVNKKDIHYWNAAIGAKARLPIRPVYIVE